MSLLSKLFGTSPTVNYKELVQSGAVILDVRTPQEYDSGHIRGSINIPLQALNATAFAKLKKDKAVITCCASGMRSASARSLLLSNGFGEVYNAGSWNGLQSKL